MGIPARPHSVELGEECNSTDPLVQRPLVRFWARIRIRVMENGEACIMHLTPGVFHNSLKAVGV